MSDADRALGRVAKGWISAVSDIGARFCMNPDSRPESGMKPPGWPIIRMTGGLCHSGESASVGRDVPEAGGILPV